MNITEVRRRFEAFGAGAATTDDVCEALAHGVAADPHLKASYIALVTAFHRSGTFPDSLHGQLIAQLEAVADGTPASPELPVRAESNRTGAEPTRFQRPVHPPGEADESSARSNAPSVKPNQPREPAPGGIARHGQVEPTLGTSTGTGTNTGSSTGSTTGSAWDSPERLAEPVTPIVVGSILKRRFELVSELGRGGMGVVYKALDRANAELKDRNPFVAIKVLSEEFKRHPLAVRALQREARKAQKLAHPNIVTVFDFDRDGGNVFMVMELLEGQSLDHLLRHDAMAGLAVYRVTQMVTAFGEALSYAHEQGIIHSDFKPSNAFLTTDGLFKVLDFGIARAAQSRGDGAERTVFDVSQLGAISPPYASLEMLRGDPPDQRDDVYGLACVTYEMLTGRHPFNRIDAQKARDANLQPALIKSLSRSQWRAVRDGLAFERERRTPTVTQFVNGFAAKPASRAWIVPAAVVAAIAVGAVVLVPRQWQGFQARRLASELAQSTPASFESSYAHLMAAPPALRDRALANEAARAKLIAYAREETASLTTPPRYDFRLAREKLQRLSQLVPDSQLIADLLQSLEQAAKVAIGRELDLRDQLLAQGALLPTEGKEDVATVLERIRQIDPGNPALSEARLPGVYATAARAAVDAGHFDTATQLVDTGLRLAPTDPRLLDIKDRVDLDAQRVANLKTAGEIEQRLGELDSAAPDFLEKALARRDDLLALASANPTSPLAHRLEAALETLTSKRIKQQLAAGDVAGAQELLLNVGDLLPNAVVAQARAAVLEGARAQEARALDTLDRLRRAALTGRISQTGSSGAIDLYAELQRTGASPDILAEARDLLAYGYLRESRRARHGRDLAGAQKKLQAATALRPGQSLQAMLDAEKQVAEADGRAAAASNAADVDAARGRFAAALHAPTLGGPELSAMAEALDRLESIGASAQEIASGLRQVEDRVLAELGRLQKEGPDQAQLLSRQAGASLPASERLADAARQLRNSGSREGALSVSPEAGALREQLAAAIGKPEATERWASELRRILQRLSAFAPPADPAFAEARHASTATFVAAAERARVQKRYTEAANLTEFARTIDVDAAELTDERQAIERDRSSTEAAAASLEQQANIDAVKQRLRDQAAAGDVVGANVTANALRRVLAGSIYVATDVPQLLISAYSRRAKAQLRSGQVDAALKTLADGRQKFGTSPELKSLEARYVIVGDSYDRISTAVNLNAAEQRGFLEALRGSEGADYTAIERMLAQTLANRIADQRVANRTSVVASLLEAGRKVFPEYGTLLEQGTAGLLPNTPIAVSVDERTGNHPR